MPCEQIHIPASEFCTMRILNLKKKCRKPFGTLKWTRAPRKKIKRFYNKV